MMSAAQRHSLSELGVRDMRTAQERTKQRVEDEAAEGQAAQVLAHPLHFKLRGKQVSLADYITDGRVRGSLMACISIRVQLDKHSNWATFTLAAVCTFACL